MGVLARLAGLVNKVGVLANELDVEHGHSSLCAVPVAGPRPQAPQVYTCAVGRRRAQGGSMQALSDFFTWLFNDRTGVICLIVGGIVVCLLVAVLMERIIAVAVELLRKQPLSRSERVRGVNDDQVVGITLRPDKPQAVFVKNLYSLVNQTVGNLRNIFPAHLHKQRIRLHHVDRLYRVIFDQLSDDSAVAPSYYKHPFYIRMHRHRHMGDHLMVDKFIPLGQHQISVHDKDLSEVFRLKDVDPLDIALGAEELFLNADGQLHAVRMYIRKPHFHMDSHSFSKICNLTANVSLLYLSVSTFSRSIRSSSGPVIEQPFSFA